MLLGAKTHKNEIKKAPHSIPTKPILHIRRLPIKTSEQKEYYKDEKIETEKESTYEQNAIRADMLLGKKVGGQGFLIIKRMVAEFNPKFGG